MALTPAERAKRYREKLKQDPIKYEAQRKKQLERLKKNQRKISQLSEEEKIKKRELWRKQKRKQKIGRNQNKEQPPPKKQKEPTHSFKIKYKKIKDKYTKFLKKMEQLQKTVSRLRKQLFRTKVQHAKEEKALREENMKLQARHEILELSLKEKYIQSQSVEEKKLLRSIATTKAAQEKKGSQVIAKCLGLKSKIRFSNKKRYLSRKIGEEIRLFYERDDISRCTAGKKECKAKKGEKKQIGYLTDTLVNLFKIYKEEGGKYRFTTFYKYKPYYVLTPSTKIRETCLCIKHSNFQFLFEALQKRSIISFKTIKDLITEVTCDANSQSCMYNTCITCKDYKIKYKKNESNDEVSWWQWERESKSYMKSGVVQTTKITKKNQKNGTVENLISQFEVQVKSFLRHYYNVKEQQKQYRSCISNLNEVEIAILCDFSENFDCKLSQEVQSMHFGGSKNSISLHTGMIFGNNKCQSFTTLSDDNCHEPNAIWAHLFPVLKFAKSVFGNIQVIHFFSDGPSSQYRQKKNFFLLNYFATKLNLNYATWNFSESGHGKGIADGIGGSVKRTLDRRVLYGNDIVDASDALRILESSMKLVKCFYVSSSDMANIKSLTKENLKAVPGTMQLHQIITKNGQSHILHRQLSCFCGSQRGLCICLNPQKHEFAQNTKSKPVKISNDSSVPSNPRRPEYQDNLDSIVPFNINDVKKHNYDIPLDSILNNSESKATNFNNNSISSGQIQLHCSRRHDANITIEPTPRNIVDNELECRFNSDNIELPIGLNNTNALPITTDTGHDYVNINSPDTANDNSLTENIITETMFHMDLYDVNALPFNVNTDLGDINFEPLNATYTSVTENVLAETKFPNLHQKFERQPNVDHNSNNNRSLNENFDKCNRKRIQILSDIRVCPNKKTKTTKSIVIAKSNRKFFCTNCKIYYPFKLHEMVSCMICKTWICIACASKPFHLDYICNSCKPKP